MKKKLQIIKPGKEECAKFNSITASFLKKLKFEGADIILGGSGAKDTWLSGNHDVDIFVRFNYEKYSHLSHELADLLEKILKQTFPKKEIKKLHGSRDYFQLVYKNLNFEVVPILEIKHAKEAMNITDISPLHSVWINKNAKGIKDEIRLAKQFCRANKLYGAESYLSGFSGYILEILVTHYGSFEKLLKASQKWKLKEVLDPEKHYKNKEMVMFHLNNSKLLSPLIIVDPVDKDRNAAAALSKDKFLQFKNLAKLYLKEPMIEFFEPKEIVYKELKIGKGRNYLVFLDIETLSGKEDVIGVKLLKVFNFLSKELSRFKIKDADWDWDHESKAKFYFILRKKKLSEYEIRKGPPLNLKDYAKDFKKKNKDTYVEKDCLMAKVKNNKPLLKDYLKSVVKKEYFKERIKKIAKMVVI